MDAKNEKNPSNYCFTLMLMATPMLETKCVGDMFEMLVINLNIFVGYVFVGDGCWWQLVLMIGFRCPIADVYRRFLPWKGHQRNDSAINVIKLTLS